MGQENRRRFRDAGSLVSEMGRPPPSTKMFKVSLSLSLAAGEQRRNSSTLEDEERVEKGIEVDDDVEDEDDVSNFDDGDDKDTIKGYSEESAGEPLVTEYFVSLSVLSKCSE